ncbi:MAG: hypothetical protein ACYC8T_08225 [Myxococcaceae bacterium]
MPSRSLLPLASIAALALGCQPPGFRTELKGDATVPGGPDGPLTGFPPIAALSGVDFDANPDFKNQGITRAQVVGGRAESASLRILSPLDQDFGFLDSLQLVARSGDRETLIAEKVGISELGLPAPNPTLGVPVLPGELLEHLAAPATSFIIRARGRLPPKDTRIELTVVLRVDG